jgi:hypothetical protein
MGSGFETFGKLRRSRKFAPNFSHSCLMADIGVLPAVMDHQDETTLDVRGLQSGRATARFVTRPTPGQTNGQEPYGGKTNASED